MVYLRTEDENEPSRYPRERYEEKKKRRIERSASFLFELLLL